MKAYLRAIGTASFIDPTTRVLHFENRCRLSLLPEVVDTIDVIQVEHYLDQWLLSSFDEFCATHQIEIVRPPEYVLPIGGLGEMPSKAKT